MPNNSWLFEKLKEDYQIDLAPQYEPTINFSIGGFSFRVYTPAPRDYIVSADVVERAIQAGANVIAYASSWAEPTIEGKNYADENGLRIFSYREFFQFIKKSGVRRS